MIVFVVSLTEAIEQQGGFDFIDRAQYDLWHRIAGTRHIPGNVVLVLLDDETLRAHPGEPLAFWGPHYARAIQILRNAGARVIGVDFMFAVSAEAWLRKLGVGAGKGGNFDAPLRQQLHSGSVVLAGVIDSSGRPQLPIMDYRAVLPGFPAITDHIGLVNVIVDADGVTRSFAMTPYDYDPSMQQQSPRLLNFAPLLGIRATAKDPNAPSWRFGNSVRHATAEPRLIGYTGPPGTIPRISLQILLNGDANDETVLSLVRDKVVIIGLDHASDQDLHATPYSGGLHSAGNSFMNGAELHANIVETILAQTNPRTIPDLPRLFFVAAIVCLVSFMFRRTRPWRGLSIGFGMAATTALIAYLMFELGWDLPVGQSQAAILASFLATLGLRLTEEEKERSRLRELFGRYVSDDIVDALLSQTNRPDLGGEEVVVTALFSDIRNFSVYSETLGPEKTLAMLNAHWSRVCEPILANGGTIFSFAGDLVFAVFGAPVRHQDHALRAVRAALEMQRITIEYARHTQRSFEEQALPPFAIGIGLHTGKVLAGSMGFSRRTEYTAIGETINTASRLEGLNKTLGWPVIASVATANAAGPSLRLGERLKVEVAGRREPIEIVEIKDIGDLDLG